MRTVEKIHRPRPRLQHCNWPTMTRTVDAHGWAIVEHLLTPVECRSVAACMIRTPLLRHLAHTDGVPLLSYPCQRC